MDAKLTTAIDKWRKASYVDNRAFQRELEPLYKSLVEATQDTPGQTDVSRQQTKQIKDSFLSEDNKVLDSCVRWHLLKLAIDNSRSETETSNAHLQLAKAIMECEKEGWNLLFFSPTGKTMRALCKREQDGGRSGQSKQRQPTKQKGKDPDAPAVVAEATNNNPHLYVKPTDEKEKTLFATALCKGHPQMEKLLVKAKELYRGKKQPKLEKAEPKGPNEVFADLVRSNHRTLHEDIVKNQKTAQLALGHVLHAIPGVLQDPDKVVDKKNTLQKRDVAMLDRVIEQPLLRLADVILASEHHCKLLTTRERIVKAIENWMEKRCQQSQGAPPLGNHHNQDDDYDDDDEYDEPNDDDGDDESSRQHLAVEVLSHAPREVLQSPDVLTEVMKHSLFDEVDILRAYAKDARDANRDNSSTPPTPFIESLKGVASFLQDVPGILHMAVHFRQQPLVQILLRREPLLAVTRAYVQISANETFPRRNEPEAFTETTTAAVDGANGLNGVSRDQEVQNVDSGYYPLWYNNNKESIQSPSDQDKNMMTRKQIRSALIYCTMRYAENVQTLLTILRESRENEINFDMSRLLIEGTSVADFVTSMPRQGRSYSLIRYEETIRYAEFPVLDLSTQPQTSAAQNLQRSHLQRTHTEILDMLDWLYDHGVRRIITLRVPDRMAHPHDELEIASVVKRFRVEELDWRILDLSLNIFQPHYGPEDIPFVCSIDNNKSNDKRSKDKSVQRSYLTQLHLYTGGRRSALDHWFSTEGLASMNLEHVYIHVIKELTTKKQSDVTLKYIHTKVDELKKRKPSMQIDVQSQFWTAQTETPRLQEIIHHLSPRLAQFIAYYRQRASECLAKSKSKDNSKDKSFKPTKVAIIDNGILSIDTPNAPRVPDRDHAEDVPDLHGNSNNNNSSSDRHLNSPDFLTADSLWARVCDGKSFVHEQDRVSPWYFASNPHGTQMANLVCAIDPLCQLFVAKIADGHYGYSAVRAEAAVDWAINKDVDIISMSFTTTEDYRPFREAVQRAMKKGILVVCSHHDEGARISTQVFPACLGNNSVDSTMLRMASCNMYGKLQHDWDDSAADNANRIINQYDFCINSQDVAVGSIPFLATSTEHISGSSVATAIAAGVCSLLIACLRTLQVIDIENLDRIDRRDTIQQMYDNVNRALAPKDHDSNRPAYADIKAYLATMAPSLTNPRFISLDRFAHLDELRDVNTNSVSDAFFNLGAKFSIS